MAVLAADVGTSKMSSQGRGEAANEPSPSLDAAELGQGPETFSTDIYFNTRNLVLTVTALGKWQCALL
jgi:hypothetical protein